MKIDGKRLGVAVTGSFCTFQRSFPELERLMEHNVEIQTIFSDAASGISSRFGEASDFLEKAETITGKTPFLSIEEAERIGPTGMFDALLVMPCTGNTLAKLANGITDGPVMMAIKAHLRNERPVILCIASNDALGFNMKNIGILLNSKNIYFVPFSQDDPVRKPNSLVSHTELVRESIEAALDGKQLQPVIR